MDWDQLRMLRDRGVDLALHGGRHLPMTGFDATELAADIDRCRNAFRTELGATCNSLAYPYGDFDEPTARALFDLGIELGFAIIPRPWRPDDNALQIPRIEIRRDLDLAAFARLVAAGRPTLCETDA
jgi:peptidoglycan/xylan/chitin deacetylase (PgdA/CDA1 family)